MPTKIVRIGAKQIGSSKTGSKTSINKILADYTRKNERVSIGRFGKLKKKGRKSKKR